MIEFQQSRKLGTNGFEKGKVTKGWWRGFLRRNENKIGGLSTDTFEGNGVEGGADVDDDEYGW